jgi:hypothetical protein
LSLQIILQTGSFLKKNVLVKLTYWKIKFTGTMFQVLYSLPKMW